MTPYLFNALAVGMVPAYLFAKADLGGSMTEASIDLQQLTFRRRMRLHRATLKKTTCMQPTVL
jgi:hypothetical protein